MIDPSVVISQRTTNGRIHYEVHQHIIVAQDLGGKRNSGINVVSLCKTSISGTVVHTAEGRGNKAGGRIKVGLGMERSAGGWLLVTNPSGTSHNSQGLCRFIRR